MCVYILLLCVYVFSIVDNLIPSFAFGDIKSHDKALTSFRPNQTPCIGLEDSLACYKHCTEYLQLSGPTSFAPAIYKAIEIVREEENSYHILLILADGQLSGNAKEVCVCVCVFF